MDYLHHNTIKNYFLPLLREQWRKAEETLPVCMAKVSPEEKERNEAYIKDMSAVFRQQFGRYPRLPIGKNKWRKDTYRLIYQVLNEEPILHIQHYLPEARLECLVTEMKTFMKKVRMDAPELSKEDMGQAARNYIVYLMFKEIHHDTAYFSEACYGYSMLYPFTDNYIDNISCSKEEKCRYNSFIRDYLKGSAPVPASAYDEKTMYFLSLAGKAKSIESSCPASELLLMMLEAQEESLQQQSMDTSLDYERRLGISLFKGGISVLIDRFYVEKELTKEDMIFYLGFGFFLQLADDLQDIKEDSNNGHQTLFTLNLSAKAEEKLVNKLFFFITALCSAFPAGNKVFLDFVLTNCYQLILMGVQKSREYFSEAYITQLAEYYPVSFTYFASPDNLFSGIKGDEKRLDKIIETLLL